jgi:hypothetical protein
VPRVDLREQALAQRLGALGVAQAEACARGLGERAAPARAALGQERHGLERARFHRGVVALPEVRLGLAEAQLAELFALRAAVNAALGSGDRRVHVVALERLLGGAQEPAHGPRGLAALLEVLREHDGLALAGLLQKGAGEAVAELSIGGGQHGVGRLAHERVTEGVLVVGGGRARAAHDDLALDQRGELIAEVPLGIEIVAEQRAHAGLGEALAEDAPRAEQPPRLGAQRLEARLHHGHHRLWRRVALPFGDGAQQLFQVEGVSRGLRAQPLHERGHRGLAEHLPHQALGGLARELAQAKLGAAAIDPEIREEGVHLGAREREHEERVIGEVAQRRVDEADARQIAPVEIFEHEDHRLRARLLGEEILEGAAHLIAHQHGIDARGAELHALFVGEGHGGELAQELGHAGAIGLGHVSRHPRAELLAPHGEGLALHHARGAPEGGADHPEGRARAHRIALTEEDLHGLRARLEGAEELVPEARFAHARGRRHQHRPRDGVVLALVEEAAEEAELALAAHAGNRAAEQRARRSVGLLLADEHEAAVVPAQREARVEQAGRDLVDGDPSRPALEQPRRSVEGLAHRPRRGGVSAARGERELRVRSERAQGERAAGGAGGLIRGRAPAGHGDHEGPTGEGLDATAEGAQERAGLLDGRHR